MSHFSRTIKYSAIQFTRSSKSTGILLIVCTLISLILSNLPFGEDYMSLWKQDFSCFSSYHLPATIVEWINDGLMALFFLAAGMEIKRELLTGELKSLKSAILPLVAAVGGVVVPAVIYTLFNKHTAYAHGWGIPTATDIAFSIGIMSLLGRRYVPDPLKIFLTALAIIDDLIAIVIVAFFYGAELNWMWLGGAVIISVILYFLYNHKSQTGAFHCLLGIALWYAMHRSGIHATLAGVVFAFLIPVKTMTSIEHKIHLPVNFLIIPLFAMVNICIPFNVSWHDISGHSLFWGVALGLFLGKVLGITLLSYLLIRAKWAQLPARTSWHQFIGAGMLAGIGFTMSIFIASLAFDNEEWQKISKIAILGGSSLSMVIGYIWLRASPSSSDIR